MLLLSLFSGASFRRLYLNSCTEILAIGIWIEGKKQLAIRRQCKKQVSVFLKNYFFKSKQSKSVFLQTGPFSSKVGILRSPVNIKFIRLNIHKKISITLIKLYIRNLRI